MIPKKVSTIFGEVVFEYEKLVATKNLFFFQAFPLFPSLFLYTTKPSTPIEKLFHAHPCNFRKTLGLHCRHDTPSMMTSSCESVRRRTTRLQS